MRARTGATLRWRAALERGARALWRTRGPAACALWPLSLITAALVVRRQSWYRQHPDASTRLAPPVIVIGNVIAGGAGKTPTTLAIAQHLKDSGWRPGIVSRGFGRASDQVLEVTRDATPDEAGDEPLLLQRRAGVPVFVGRQRARAAQSLLAAHPEVDVLLCDDGLQHLALARDIEICVFDARGIGNGWLLPAGPLREPWPRPVDLILATDHPAPALDLLPGATLHQATRALAASAVRANGRTVALADLGHTPLIALAGIAQPEAFFAMLRDRGLRLARALALPDHADPGALAASLPADAPLVCTEKDAPKLWRIRPDALAVPLELTIPQAFYRALDALLEDVPLRTPRLN